MALSDAAAGMARDQAAAAGMAAAWRRAAAATGEKAKWQQRAAADEKQLGRRNIIVMAALNL